MKKRIRFLITTASKAFLLLNIFNTNVGFAQNITPVNMTRSSQTFPPSKTVQIGVGDFDNDGDLDAVFANMGLIYSQVMVNDGKGQFTDSGQKLTQQGHGVGVGDLDGDGDLDLFFTCAGYGENNISYKKPSRIYFNDSKGNFTDSGQDLGDTELSGNGLELVDIDSDGDLDGHIYYYKRSVDPYFHIVYLNDGKGRFTKSEISLPDGSFLFWGDLDGDSKPDMFMMEWGKGLRAMLNVGDNHFTDCWQVPVKTIEYGYAALGDIDSDGDLDAVVANGGKNYSDPTRVFFNDGSGRFKESSQKLSSTKWAALSLGDLNGDGSLDIYIDNYGIANEVWLNDGKGQFIDSGLRICENERSGTSALGDFDGDGNIDVFVPFFGEGSNSVWFNRK